MGYIGHSMSERARDAYASGEKPLSKWTKADIIEAMEDAGWHEESIEAAKAMPIAKLREKALSQSSWHHTGMYYNRTDFYSLDEDESTFAYDIEPLREKMAKEEAERFKEWLSSCEGKPELIADDMLTCGYFNADERYVDFDFKWMNNGDAKAAFDEWGGGKSAGGGGPDRDDHGHFVPKGHGGEKCEHDEAASLLGVRPEDLKKGSKR